MKLNFDVLEHICKQVDGVPDILAFTTTCSTLRRTGVRILLSYGTVVVSFDEAFQKFYNMVFPGDGTLVAHLRAL